MNTNKKLKEELTKLIRYGEERDYIKDSISVLELIQKEKEFYEYLKKFTKFANEQMKKELDFLVEHQSVYKLEIPSVSNEFYINLYNNYLELTTPKYKKSNTYLYLNYNYNQEQARNKYKKYNETLLDEICLGNKKIYETEKGFIEFYTNNYVIRRLLTRNDCENIIHLLDSIHIYKEILPSRITKSNKKKKVLSK